MSCLSKVFFHSIEDNIIANAFRSVEDTVFPPLCFLCMPAFYLQRHNRVICFSNTNSTEFGQVMMLKL